MKKLFSILVVSFLVLSVSTQKTFATDVGSKEKIETLKNVTVVDLAIQLVNLTIHEAVVTGVETINFVPAQVDLFAAGKEPAKFASASILMRSLRNRQAINDITAKKNHTLTVSDRHVYSWC